VRGETAFAKEEAHMQALLELLVGTYGLTPFQCDRQEYENTLLRRLGDKDYRRLKRFQEVPDALKDSAWAAEYYDFLGHYSRGGLCSSLKTLTLAAHGSNIDRVLPREGRILEVGTHLGAVAAWYAQQAKGRTVVGIDIAERAIFEAKKKAARGGVANVGFVAGDFFEWNPADPFDAAVDTQALCDLPDPQPFFLRLGQMLRPGALFVSVPSRGTPDLLAEYLRALVASGFGPQFVGYHSASDLGEPVVYPMVVAVRGGETATLDLQETYRRIFVALVFVKWGILLRATDGPPEVSLFMPSEEEAPDVLLEGDRPISVNGVDVEVLEEAQLGPLYERDRGWALRFDRGGAQVEVRYD
jgi:2-polyprenyl-3-methyl-5-hydroxy-6-metoxy-1,4-benzoquinol methylase